jgi:hypothetical protein
LFRDGIDGSLDVATHGMQGLGITLKQAMNGLGHRIFVYSMEKIAGAELTRGAGIAMT